MQVPGKKLSLNLLFNIFTINRTSTNKNRGQRLLSFFQPVKELTCTLKLGIISRTIIFLVTLMTPKAHFVFCNALVDDDPLLVPLRSESVKSEERIFKY